jgi:hypothetical protein
VRRANTNAHEHFLVTKAVVNFGSGAMILILIKKLSPDCEAAMVSIYKFIKMKETLKIIKDNIEKILLIS